MIEKEISIYMAGFFDGEGYIGLLKRKRTEIYTEYFIQMAIGQKDGATMDWIQENFGGYIHKVRRDGSYFWIVTGQAAFKVLERITPYLKYKKPQALLAVEFYKGKIKRTKATQEAERKRKEIIYLKLKHQKKVFTSSTYCKNARVQRLNETTPKGDVIV